MNLATNLFVAYLVFFISTYIKIAFNKEKRESHQTVRKRLDELRKIPLKTAKEQKEFIDLKYPKTPPFKWTYKNVGIFILKLGTMVCIFLIARHGWKTYIGVEFALWQVILIMVVLPIILNFILKKFNLHQDDILIFFR